ncbi:uncharacterized protein PRCAT00005670001 [Priceomyces carsonii]|uniref:uncharacterized protein n=1 Tax=Priceomyces carsonii TaxID=28549 RepID=UPI002EDB32FF|nr:unnamed protein product [Priceomyces carsonii]
MKFGKTFATHQIPEWSIFYMNYKHLKKIIKGIDQSLNIEDEKEIPNLIASVLSTFFYELDRDIEKVDNFYNNKFKEYNRRLDKTILILGYKNKTIHHQIESNEELDEIISILLELRTIYRNLKWYGELNHKGFTKILKKLDKKLTLVANNTDEFTRNNKENYLSTRVNALPFANEYDLIQNLKIINNILNSLSDEEFGENIDKSFDFLKIVGRRRHSFDQEFLEHYYELIIRDDSNALLSELKKLLDDKITHKFLLSLLNRSVLINSMKSIKVLIDFLKQYAKERNVDPLFDKSDISGRNFFHQHISSLGKRQVIKEQQLTPGETIDINRFIGNMNGPDGVELTINTIDGLNYVLDHLENKELLTKKDNYDRTPLHYGAQYGLKDATKSLLSHMIAFSLVKSSIDDIEIWGDQERLTPLHLSIIGNHPKTTENLIIYSKSKLTCPSLLLLAVRSESPKILEHLIKGGIDVDYTDPEHNNETALYIASKLNYVNLVEFLMNNNANSEIGENVFGWTPIFVAASEGFEDVVKILVAGGCNYEIVDDSGWLPMEHACLRGHLTTADLLKPHDENLLLYDMYHPENNVSRQSIINSNSVSNEDITTSSIDKLPETRVAVAEVYKQLKNNGSTSSIPRSRSPKRHKPKPIKSFGHRYLTKGESLILITLGSTDVRDKRDPVSLNKISFSKSFLTELDTALSLSITCRQKLTNVPVEPPVIIDMPLEGQHGSATDPISFKLIDGMTPSDVIITFDIVPTYQVSIDRKDKILGRAVALLNNAYTKVGSNLRSLYSSITLPITEANNLDILGAVNFEYLYVKSFNHPQMKIGRGDTYWKQLVSTRVIGHRGLGQNSSGRKSLQLGENTVESFIAAASLGASYVEFDVQLTKDFIPVVYHDFTVAESGVDIPMHALTAEQFLNLNESKDSHKVKHSMDDEWLSKMNRPRAMSSYPKLENGGNSPDTDDEIEREYKDQFSTRMKLTKTWKAKGFKGNARGLSVASNFVTLKELFKKIPKNVGFNIELKYPMLDEAEHESMGEIAIDLNFYVDTILKVVYDENTTGRDILFSSFHPDVCLLLSLKQPTIPILFLTDAGTVSMADIRATSLQNAIRFAKKWNLLGVVSAAETLVKAPRLTQVVKSSGLVCVTYGVKNNDPEIAKRQMKAGVDAVIADSVLAVRDGLRKDQSVLKEYSSGSD